MKLPHFVFALITLFLSCVSCFSQKSAEPILIDEHGEICSESIAARLDHLISDYWQYPSAKIRLIFYGGQTEGRNLNYLSYYKTYLLRDRGFNADKFEVTRGENQENIKAQFWIVPQNVEPPKPENLFVKPLVSAPTMFDKGTIEASPWFSLSFNGGFGEWGCSVVNSGDFVSYLLETPNLNGYIVVYTAFGKANKRADKIAKYALQSLIRRKIPRNRLKTIYGGSRKESEIELWLVPQNTIFPKPIRLSKPQY